MVNRRLQNLFRWVEALVPKQSRKHPTTTWLGSAWTLTTLNESSVTSPLSGGPRTILLPGLPFDLQTIGQKNTFCQSGLQA